MSASKCGAEGASSAKVQCSFCEKDQHEVESLIAGLDVYICDECVQLCVTILNDKENEKRC